MTAIVIGSKKLQSRFKTLAKGLENRVVLFKRIGVKLLQEIDKTFRNETHEGEAWSPLSEATLAKAGRGGESAKILQDTGTLRRSFVSEPTNKKVTVGTPIKYAKYHEKEGFEEADLILDRLPQRKMLPSKERRLEIAIDATEKFIKTRKSRSGV